MQHTGVVSLSADEHTAVDAAFTLVGRHRVLREPLHSITLPPTVAARSALHPVERAVLAQDDDLLGVEIVDSALRSPLMRVGVYAAYLAFGWSPNSYEYAVEKAGVLMASGVRRIEADRTAVAMARVAFAIARVCGTCRWFTLMSRTATYGVCTRLDNAVQPGDVAPDMCYSQATRAEEYNAAMLHEQRQVSSTAA